MPRIVQHPLVLKRMTARGLSSLYPHSGAFGFTDRSAEIIVGWIGAEDASIRPEMRRHAAIVPPPVEQNLARLFTQSWAGVGGSIWLMPKTHWHHELHHGGGAELDEALRQSGTDPALLHDRAAADAIEFAPAEAAIVERFIVDLFAVLRGSDFMIAFIDQPLLCTVHHHRQLWWQTTDAAIAGNLAAAGASIAHEALHKPRP